MLQYALFARLYLLPCLKPILLIVINLAPPPSTGHTQTQTMDQQNHHPFVDLDNHESQTDAEALEAIRVAIGQSADFNDQPLSDVLHNHDHGEEQDQEEIEDGLPPRGVGDSLLPTYSSGGSLSQLEKSLNDLLEVSQASLWEIETANAPVSGDTLARIQGHGKRQLQMTKNLLAQLKQMPQPCEY
jgi:hypothetical protein